MAVNHDYAGRTFPATAPYEVSRVKIAEFADAIGDPNRVYRDLAAAQAAGYPDVIAPPTFAIVISMAASGTAIADPGLGIDYSMVVHGEQRFSYARPIHAGDVVTAMGSVPIRSMADLRGRLYVTAPDSRIGLSVADGSTTRVVDVTLSASP